MNKKIKNFLEILEKTPGFDKVEFVFLFGSVSEKKQNNLSDIDFAVFFNGNKKERFKFRLSLLSQLNSDFDVQIFQDLPFFVRINVLKGKLIYFKDKNFVYETAYSTIKHFEYFRKHYRDYLNTRKMKI